MSVVRVHSGFASGVHKGGVRRHVMHLPRPMHCLLSKGNVNRIDVIYLPFARCQCCYFRYSTGTFTASFRCPGWLMA